MKVKCFRIQSGTTPSSDLNCDELNTWLHENRFQHGDVTAGRLVITSTITGSTGIAVTVLYDDVEMEQRKYLHYQEQTAHRLGIKG